MRRNIGLSALVYGHLSKYGEIDTDVNDGVFFIICFATNAQFLAGEMGRFTFPWGGETQGRSRFVLIESINLYLWELEFETLFVQ